VDQAVSRHSLGISAPDIPVARPGSAAADAEYDHLYQAPLMKMLLCDRSNSDSEAIAVGTPAEADWRSVGPHSTVSRSPTGVQEHSAGDLSSCTRTASPESHPSDTSFENFSGDAAPNTLTHREAASQTCDHVLPIPSCDVDNFITSVRISRP
jgi:hypothetical protein